jgi:hypothetical protein
MTDIGRPENYVHNHEERTTPHRHDRTPTAADVRVSRGRLCSARPLAVPAPRDAHDPLAVLGTGE